MRVGSVIMGIDLVPIRPIRNVITIAQDITEYAKCRSLIKEAIKDKFDHMVDVVLNDGAPNVGANWLRDAFVQSELVLCALRLACEILRPGGWYITKVFRSQDYNSLLWVFNQFFTKVEAHKPSASRNVSAEIFVVCQGFKAPKKVDPKMFDAKSIFANIESSKPMDVLTSKQKKNRDGYADDVSLGMFKSTSVMTFIDAKAPVEELAKWNVFKMEGDDEAVMEIVKTHEATTEDITLLFADLKVLSKTEFKQMLRWRSKIKDAIKESLDPEDEEGEESDEESDEELDEETKELNREETLLEQIDELKHDIDAKKKRKRKKEREKKSKLQRRVDMGMEVGRDQEDPTADAAQQDGLFQLARINTDMEGMDELQQGAYAAPSDDDEDAEAPVEELDYAEEQERWLEEAYGQYATRRKKRFHEEETQDMPYLADKSVAAGEEEEDEDEEDEDDEEEDDDNSRKRKRKGNALIVEKPGDKKKDATSAKKAKAFFSNQLFDGLDEEEEEDQFWKDRDSKRQKSLGEKSDVPTEATGEATAAASKKQKAREEATIEQMNAEFEVAVKDGGKSGSGDGSSDEEDADWEAAEAAKEAYRQERVKYLPKDENSLAETLVLGQKMLRKKQRHEIIDASYNRYAFNDGDDIPAWFKEEESRHNKPQLPVTKREMEMMKLQWQAVDARPIKKLAEAKARKKKKKDKAYQQLTQRANAAINAEEGSSLQAEKEKLLKQLISKNLGKGRKDRMSIVVSNKGGNKKSGDKKGAGGKQKVVDKRMKKDTRSQKAAMRKAMKQNYGRVPKNMQQQKSRTKSKKDKRAAELGI